MVTKGNNLLAMQPMSIIRFFELAIKSRTAEGSIDGLEFCKDAGEECFEREW